MDTQKLYEEWSAARNEVVKASTRHLYAETSTSRAELEAHLVAERVARLRFEGALRAESDTRVTLVSP